MRVLVVDDEAPARAKLRRMLGAEPDVDEAAEAAGGAEAIARLSAERFDAALLDVQMPRVDGFDVVAAVGVERMPPALVFVTAHDRFALRAFEVRALDYLLKPVAPARFAEAMARVRERLGRREEGATPPRPKPLERLLVEDGDAAILLEVARIDRVAAERNYVRLFVGPRTYSLRGTLASIAEALGDERFLQVNRSDVVRLDFVRAVHPLAHGDASLTLQDGTELGWSRRYRSRDGARFSVAPRPKG
jgi:two-component system, LytTR family, response regulator